MPDLNELRERCRLAQEALDALDALTWDDAERSAAVDALHEAFDAYHGQLGSRLTEATVGEDTDTPPGYQIATNDHGEWTFCEGGGSWDDEFVASTYDRARLECWSRFARSDTAWAERLLTLLTAVVPEVPELPPGYTIGDCEDGTWAIRVDGCYHDGLDDDEIPTTREEAIEVSWNDWWRGASEEWREFMTELGVFGDEDEST